MNEARTDAELRSALDDFFRDGRWIDGLLAADIAEVASLGDPPTVGDQAGDDR